MRLGRDNVEFGDYVMVRSAWLGGAGANTSASGRVILVIGNFDIDVKRCCTIFGEGPHYLIYKGFLTYVTNVAKARTTARWCQPADRCAARGAGSSCPACAWPSTARGGAGGGGGAAAR